MSLSADEAEAVCEVQNGGSLRLESVTSATDIPARKARDAVCNERCDVVPFIAGLGVCLVADLNLKGRGVQLYADIGGGIIVVKTLVGCIEDAANERVVLLNGA